MCPDDGGSMQRYTRAIRTEGDRWPCRIRAGVNGGETASVVSRCSVVTIATRIKIHRSDNKKMLMEWNGAIALYCMYSTSLLLLWLLLLNIESIIIVSI